MTGTPVLVTGAGGKTGRAVVSALRERGASVRALVRDARRHADLASDREVEVVAGDQRDVTALQTAADGCGAVYGIAPNVSPHEVEMGRALLAACDLAGVPRVVFHSVADPHQPAMPHHLDKGQVEHLIQASGLEWTILRPNAYLQNLDGYLDGLRHGPYRVPYASDRGLAMVDLREVAEVAAGCLLGRYADAPAAVWELAGPKAVTPADVAEAASEVLGRPVVAEREDPDAWAAANANLPDETRRRLHAMFLYYDRHGLPGDATTLRRLLGREPLDLRTYLAASVRPGHSPVTGSRSASTPRR